MKEFFEGDFFFNRGGIVRSVLLYVSAGDIGVSEVAERVRNKVCQGAYFVLVNFEDTKTYCENKN